MGAKGRMNERWIVGVYKLHEKLPIDWAFYVRLLSVSDGEARFLVSGREERCVVVWRR